MKKHQILSLLIVLTSCFFNKTLAQSIKPYMMSMGFEYSSGTNGYGYGITPYFSIDKQDRYFFGVGIFAGNESGYNEDGLYNDPSPNKYSSEIRGNVITDFRFNDLVSDWYYGGRFSFNYMIVLDSNINKRKKRRTITDYVVVSLGVRYNIHPATVGEYSVKSNDGSFNYYDYIEHEYLEAYSNFSPEIGISSGWYGFYYSYQNHPSDNAIHTIGLRINILNY